MFIAPFKKDKFRIDGSINTNYTGTVKFTSSDNNAIFPDIENIALSLSANQITASSQYNSSYAPTKATDGNAGTDWATYHQTSGAWIRLTFNDSVTISTVILRDRANSTDHVEASHLIFSDGSTVEVGALPNAGSPQQVTFSPRAVTWVEFYIDTAVGQNIGLAEFEVYPSDYIYTFTPTDSGSHIFSQGLTFWSVGPQTITVTDNASPALVATATITVTTADYLALDFPQMVTMSVPTTLTLTAYNQGGSVDSNYAGRIEFSSVTIQVGGGRREGGFAQKRLTLTLPIH